MEAGRGGRVLVAAAQVPSLPYAVMLAASLVLQDWFWYVIGGRGDDGSRALTCNSECDEDLCEDTCWTQCFDMKTGTWTLKAALPVQYAGSIVMPGCIVDGGIEILKSPDCPATNRVDRLRYEPTIDS